MRTLIEILLLMLLGAVLGLIGEERPDRGLSYVLTWTLAGFVSALFGLILFDSGAGWAEIVGGSLLIYGGTHHLGRYLFGQAQRRRAWSAWEKVTAETENLEDRKKTAEP